MSEASSIPGEQFFSVRRHGESAVITVSAEIEGLAANDIETAAHMVLTPLKADPPANVVVDLSKVEFFTSEFISFLLRCHMLVKKHHGDLALAGVSPRVRELLRQTNLDTLWVIYRDRNEALAALDGID